MTENVSAISYTNKDFQTIYPEILDLATRISERWTPDQSNESDPGIVLAKISAICADKNNYNIDKNVLECFPSSVTQMPNAREIYAQRGYYMHWYRSGTGQVTLAWKGDKDDSKSITLKDKFVALTGNDDQIVYTIIPTSNQPIKCDGTSTIFDVIQGVAKEYTTTSGSNVITLEDIDSENRIYFPNTSVAENGIFIKRDGVTEFSLEGWKRVDNLDAQALGQDIYEFGVSRDGSACYIEFPDDVAERIGDGINLWYIATDGLAGNIKPKYLTKFTGTVNGVQSTTGSSETEDIELTTDNITFSQANAITDCKDYESIEEAYRGYKRTIGTFDTLVTLRDYDNALRDSGLVPNGFVTDRTNDIQRSCQIMTEQNDMNVVESHINRNKDGVDDMTAFDLCIYAFQYMPKGTIQSDGADDYNKTFYMAPNVTYDTNNNTTTNISSEIDVVKAYMEDQKSIQHNFVTWGAGKILCIKNKYEVKCQIIPKYAITTLQELSIKQNIRSALYNALNSSKVEFGEEITYDKVYDIIESADERIKAVSLANIEFTPYASVYDTSKTSANVVDVPLQSLTSGDASDKPNEVTIFAKSVLAGVTPMFEQDKSIQYSLAQTNGQQLENVTSCATETKIPLNATGTKLLKNESVVFYTPSMVETYQFTLGVKVVSNIGIVNDTMTLSGVREDKDDKGNVTKTTTDVDITFLWKENNRFYAQRFTKDNGNVVGVKTSGMSPASSDTNYAIKQYDNYNQISNIVTNVGTKTDVTSFSDITSNWNKFTSINASETVSVYELNQRTTSNSDKCYWILNHKETETVNDVNTDYYVLFDKGSVKDSYYVLDSDEYFIVADSQLVNATVYGAGTKIILNQDLPNGANDKGMRVKVDPSAYKSFVEEGISALSNDMVNGLNLTIQEREFVALGEGATITYTDAAGKTLALTNTETDIAGIVKYKVDDNSDEQTLPTLSGLTRTARSRLAFNTSDGAMILETPMQSIVFDGSTTVSVDITGHYHTDNFGGNNATITLNNGSYYINFSSAYSSLSVNEPTELVDVSIGKICNAEYTSSGNNNCKVTIDFAKKTMTITSYKDDKPLDSMDLDVTNQKYIQSSPLYNLAGGANTNLTYAVIGQEEVGKATIYIYQEQTQSGFEVDTSGNMLLEKASQSTDVIFEYPLQPNVRYLFSVNKDSGDEFILQYSTDGTTYNEFPSIVSDDTSHSFTTIYYAFAVRGVKKIKITYTAQSNKTVISPMYAVTFNTAFYNGNYGAYHDVLWQKLQELDQDHQFNYMYTVPTESRIDNPLLGSSFINVNHPYNQFTICQLNTKTSIDIFGKLNAR